MVKVVVVAPLIQWLKTWALKMLHISRDWYFINNRDYTVYPVFTANLSTIWKKLENNNFYEIIYKKIQNKTKKRYIASSYFYKVKMTMMFTQKNCGICRSSTIPILLRNQWMWQLQIYSYNSRPMYNRKITIPKIICPSVVSRIPIRRRKDCHLYGEIRI